MPLSTRRIPLEIQIPDDHPELLNGLDVWLRLGLISDRQVRRWASQYLVSKVLDSVDISVDVSASQQDLRQNAQTVTKTISTPTRRDRDFISESPRSIKASQPNLITQILSGFMAELGVMWMLSLGVFLVVVSSAGWASLQWKNFSPVGQYGILWLYTLAFGGAALWTAKHDNLRRTSQMLQAATLLLVPVNFWMMDGFRLGRSVGGAVLCVLAGLVLLGMQWSLLRGDRTESRSSISNLLHVNYAALSLLHWGWMFPVVPVAAVYAGTIGTALVQWRSQSVSANQTASNQSGLNQISANSSNSFGLVVSIAGVTLLMARAFLGAHVPVGDLGLAFAISGAVLCWERNSRQFTALVGALLLGLGWCVSFDAPWPALGVNVIILALLWRRLHWRWESVVVSGLTAIGVQTYWLMQVLLSENVRSAILGAATRMAGVTETWELSGLSFLVPVAMTIGLGAYLNRRQKPDLAKLAFSLAGVMGVIFAWPGLFNPAVRSIYFLISFAILAVGNLVWARSPRDYPKPLVVLTQIAAIVTASSIIDWKIPGLGAFNWATVWVVGAVVEWALCLGLRDRLWKKSAWFTGIGLALMTWCWLMTSIYGEIVKSPIGLSVRESMLWFVIPIALTIGSRVKARSPQTMPVTASEISVVSAITVAAAAPILDWEAGSITVSVAIAFVLMVLNTRIIRNAASAAMTIGVLLLLFQFMVTRSTFSNSPWFGVMILALWVVHTGLKGRIAAQTSATGTTSNYNQLLAHYVKASDGWAIGLFSLSVVVATLFETIGWVSSPLLSLQLSPFMWFDRYTTGGILIDAALMLLGLVVRAQGVGEVWVLFGLGFGLEWFVSYFLTHQVNMVWDRSWGLSDRLSFFALSSAAIVWLMQALRPAMRRGFALSKEQVQISPNLHWTVSFCVAAFVTLFSFASPLSVTGLWQLATCFGLLSLYGFVQGRENSGYLYGAVIPLCVAIEIALSRFLPNAVLHPWGAAIASVVAFGLASVPWVRLGWPAIDPIRNCAIALPGIVLVLTTWAVNIPGLLLAGGFYAWLAIPVPGGFANGVKRFALSYISVFLGIWAAFRLLSFWGLTNPLWYVSVVALAIVFGVEFDPGLKGENNRQNRHWLRCLAIGLVSLTALFQSESSWSLGLLTIVLGLGFVGIGLVVRTRAYLYVGTLLFMFQVLRQLFVFIANYSMLLWALGITLGLMLIWVAATFESRRTSTIALLQYWSSELDRWE